MLFLSLIPFRTQRRLTVRLVRAGAVAATASLAWLLTWGFGEFGLGLATVFSALTTGQPVERAALGAAYQIGHSLQWVYGAASIMVLIAVMADRHRLLQRVGTVWVVLVLLLGVLGGRSFAERSVVGGAGCWNQRAGPSLALVPARAGCGLTRRMSWRPCWVALV